MKGGGNNSEERKRFKLSNIAVQTDKLRLPDFEHPEFQLRLLLIRDKK